MDCCSNKKNSETGDIELVTCVTCDMKTGKNVAVVMYLKGKEYFFCSQDCQDRWEMKNPKLLW